MNRVAAAVFAAVLAAAVAPGVAEARSEKTVDYEAAKVWPTAVRFLRVDAGVKITEKDADAAYVMFELVDEGKVYTGALELVIADDENGPRCRVMIHINDRPSYMEAVLLEKLGRKLREELGSPPPRKPPAKKPPAETEPPKQP